MASSPKRASNAGGKSRRKNVTLDLRTARQMLPLVRSIVSDMSNTKDHLKELKPEHDSLEKNRRELSWDARQRRYVLADEIASAEKHLNGIKAELDALGLSLSDSMGYQVDFPTKINGRTAAFTWQLGEDGVAHWHYAGEQLRRPIPDDWQHGNPIRHRSEP